MGAINQHRRMFREVLSPIDKVVHCSIWPGARLIVSARMNTGVWGIAMPSRWMEIQMYIRDPIK